MMDPQHRVFLECVWHALEDANIRIQNHNKVSVFAGTSLNTYLLNHWPQLQSQTSPAALLKILHHNGADYLATRIAYKLNCQGIAASVQTACSTSLTAIHMACQNLLTYESNIAIAGGCSIADPQMHGYYYEKQGILSPDGTCRAFDKDAQGCGWQDHVIWAEVSSTFNWKNREL